MVTQSLASTRSRSSNDGRWPYRPVRHHFGITAFGINTWTAREAGDRIINEHDEADGRERGAVPRPAGPRRSSSSTATGSSRPPGRFVFARPGVKRTAVAEEPETTVVALGGTPGKAYEPGRLGALGAAQPPLPGGRVRRGGRPRRAPGRGSSAVRRAGLQPRLLREPRRPDGRCDRPPRARDRAVGAVPRVRKGRLGLRSDPRRARVRGAGRPVCAINPN